jgi:hypothetical protein
VVSVEPTLWNEIQYVPQIKDADITRTAFSIGHKGTTQFALEGGLFTDAATVAKLRLALVTLIKPDEKFRVRKLNAIEMKHMWNDINAWPSRNRSLPSNPILTF